MSETELENRVAPDGHVYCCSACGKMSRDLFGFKPISYGWGESCAMRAELQPEDKLVIVDGVAVNIL